MFNSRLIASVSLSLASAFGSLPTGAIDFPTVSDDDGADAGESETRAPDSAVSSADEEDAEEENPAVDEEMLSAAGADEEDVAAEGAGVEQMA